MGRTVHGVTESDTTERTLLRLTSSPGLLSGLWVNVIFEEDDGQCLHVSQPDLIKHSILNLLLNRLVLFHENVFVIGNKFLKQKMQPISPRPVTYTSDLVFLCTPNMLTAVHFQRLLKMAVCGLHQQALMRFTCVYRPQNRLLYMHKALPSPKCKATASSIVVNTCVTVTIWVQGSVQWGI